MTAMRFGLRDIVRSVVLEEAIKLHLLARCKGSCKRAFVKSDAVTTVGCRVCTATFSYCEKCGGLDRAVRGGLAHVRWFASEAGQKYGDQHLHAWETYQKRAVVKLKKGRAA